MKINISDIPEGGQSVELSEDGRKIEEHAGKLDFSFLSPVTARLDFNRTDGDLFVSGVIKARISLECSRCLKEFEHDIDADFTIFYTKKKDLEKEKELKAADMDVNYLEGPEIDTFDILLSQISLDLPIKPLCTQDCKGLCPKCGADLNAGPCGCPKEDKVDSRFAKLKDLKLK